MPVQTNLILRLVDMREVINPANVISDAGSVAPTFYETSVRPGAIDYVRPLSRELIGQPFAVTDELGVRIYTVPTAGFVLATRNEIGFLPKVAQASELPGFVNDPIRSLHKLEKDFSVRKSLTHNARPLVVSRQVAAKMNGDQPIVRKIISSAVNLAKNALTRARGIETSYDDRSDNLQRPRTSVPAIRHQP